MTRTEFVAAHSKDGIWQVNVKNTTNQQLQTLQAKTLVNAAGPWINQVIEDHLGTKSEHKIRLVRGSHIVVKQLFKHNHAYFFQSSDQRIAFAIPYEEDYTLIGTTDQDHPHTPESAACCPEESQYLMALANEFFKQPITAEDIVWSYSGVRPLFDDGASKAQRTSDLGIDFGHNLSQTEVTWLIQHEFAISAEDILWRRTKLGLKFSQQQYHTLEQWLVQQQGSE